MNLCSFIEYSFADDAVLLGCSDRGTVRLSRRGSRPEVSYEATPDRNERLLFMLSIGGLLLAAVIVIAVSIFH